MQFATRVLAVLSLLGMAGAVFAADSNKMSDAGSVSVRVVLRAAPAKSSQWPASPAARLEVMHKARKVLWNRLSGTPGIGEEDVTVRDENSIVIVLPASVNLEETLPCLISTATLEFYWLKNVQGPKNLKAKWHMYPDYADGKSYTFRGPNGVIINSRTEPDRVLAKVVGAPANKPILTGKDLLPNAKATEFDQRPPAPVVNIEFTKEGAKIFSDFTAYHINSYLAIFYGNRLLTAPIIREKILDGRAQISGFAKLAEARLIANHINAGVLPVPLKVVSKEVVRQTK